MYASQRTSRPAIHKYPCFVAPSTFRHFSARTSHPFCTEFNTTVIYSTFNVQASMRSVCDCTPFSFSVIIIPQIFTKVKISLSNFHLERICTFHGRPVITGASIGSSGPYLISVYLFRHKCISQLLYLYYILNFQKNQIYTFSVNSSLIQDLSSRRPQPSRSSKIP